ncbi:hypothetical protein [Streptomyces boncukensis]|uniref:Uncharacterized protein n=1 Tax=Streptomyces boncukensis TaxID=2711219 RepID=A0A6G4WQU4_9ACTN|nr:hypothetical protein [Streptomyces boncukensis]NGO67010.1 hypothetical protein [Streptomyces boncukensis]
MSLVVVVVGSFLAAVVRGMVRKARADTRLDLVQLGSVPQAAKSLTELTDLPTYAFMAPFEEGRTHPFGWLWWRVEPNADGTHRKEMGWALTYRRARKAAGLPLSIRAQHTETIVATGHQRQTAND